MIKERISLIPFLFIIRIRLDPIQPRLIVVTILVLLIFNTCNCSYIRSSVLWIIDRGLFLLRLWLPSWLLTPSSSRQTTTHHSSRWCVIFLLRRSWRIPNVRIIISILILIVRIPVIVLLLLVHIRLKLALVSSLNITVRLWAKLIIINIISKIVIRIRSMMSEGLLSSKSFNARQAFLSRQRHDRIKNLIRIRGYYIYA